MNQETVLFESKEKMEEVLGKNTIRQLRINDELFNIVNVKSGVYIFEKSCPHMDYPLSKANINHLEEVACPWHGYRFNLKSGEESSRNCRSLQIFRTHWNESGQLVLEI